MTHKKRMDRQRNKIKTDFCPAFSLLSFLFRIFRFWQLLPFVQETISSILPSLMFAMYRVSCCYSWSDIKSKGFIWFSLKLNREEELSSFIPFNPDTLQFWERERVSSWLCNLFLEILIFVYTSLPESREDLRVEGTSSSFHLLLLLLVCGRQFYMRFSTQNRAERKELSLKTLFLHERKEALLLLLWFFFPLHTFYVPLLISCCHWIQIKLLQNMKQRDWSSSSCKIFIVHDYSLKSVLQEISPLGQQDPLDLSFHEVQGNGEAQNTRSGKRNGSHKQCFALVVKRKHRLKSNEFLMKQSSVTVSNSFLSMTLMILGRDFSSTFNSIQLNSLLKSGSHWKHNFLHQLNLPSHELGIWTTK